VVSKPADAATSACLINRDIVVPCVIENAGKF